ncbi:MAG: MlaD family protein [Solirubrobacterales bacterium]
MTDLMARLTAVTCALLLFASVAVLYVTSKGEGAGAEVKAEFEDTFPLLPGMHVRVYGAVAGAVGEVALTDEGTALVTMQLHEGTVPPSEDATAAIRQQDITGDSYVSLEPGRAEAELGDEVIPASRTLIAPRFDDLLNSFDADVREGFQLLLVEVGKALERRGDDVNRAALALRPGLEAANAALAEVRSQNQVLRELVVDAEAVTGQAAGRSRELAGLVDSLAVTLRTTSDHSPGLDAALERADEAATVARPLLAELRRAATAATPLAERLAVAAPDLALSAKLLGPFAQDAAAALDDIGPTLELTRRLMRMAEPTLEAAPTRVLTAPFDLAAGVGTLLETLLGEPKLMKALFGADAYGEGPSRLDDVGLGAVAVDPGTVQGYGANDPERRFLRAALVLSCESFGVPIEPGCLADTLGPRRVAAGSGTAANARGTAGTDGGAEPDPDAPLVPPGTPSLPRRPLETLRDLLDRAGGGLGGLLGQRRDGNPPSERARPRGGPVNDLLDFLLGP